MNKSDSIAALTAALSKAQGEITGAVKDADNPFFKSHYADLQSVWDAIRGPLSKNGLAVMQLPGMEGSAITVETVLSHSSGEWMASTLSMVPVKSDPQGVGSAITYARRYALQSVAGVAPMDDDGEAAMGRTHNPSKGAAIERHEQERENAARNVGREQPRSEPQTSGSSEATGDWRAVKVHFGRKGGPLMGKRLGDIADDSIDWLAENYSKQEAEGKTLSVPDRKLKAAVALAIESRQPARRPAAGKPDGDYSGPSHILLHENLNFAEPVISQTEFMIVARQMLPDRIPANAKFTNMSDETAKLFIDDFQNVEAAVKALRERENAGSGEENPKP